MCLHPPEWLMLPIFIGYFTGLIYGMLFMWLWTPVYRKLLIKHPESPRLARFYNLTSQVFAITTILALISIFALLISLIFATAIPC